MLIIHTQNNDVKSNLPRRMDGNKYGYGFKKYLDMIISVQPPETAINTYAITKLKIRNIKTFNL